MSEQPALLFNLNFPELAERLSSSGQLETGKLDQRNFPDGESYQRVESDCGERHCVVLANLANPNPLYLPAIFLADTLKHLGARSVTLVSPYLPYMRQDIRFHPGEALTSVTFAKGISEHFDYLITMDPHLHRYQTLSEIYSIPDVTLQGASALANWLKNRSDLLLVGPDEESDQWVGAIAASSGHPYVVGHKDRHGDRDVAITLPDLGAYSHRRPVIIDDVISSGETILECNRALRQQGFQSADCMAVHGIFADRVDSEIQQQLGGELITTNTIPHPSNCIDISPQICEAIESLIQIKE